MKRDKPVTPDDWLVEIAEAYKDAQEAIPFGTAAGVNITASELFHLAPAVCIQFRGLKQSRKNIKRATDAALSSYVATQDIPDGITKNPSMSFAFCYIASHYGLSLIQEDEANEIIQYFEGHQNQLEQLVSN